MQSLIAPNEINLSQYKDYFKIFLAGTIDKGDSENWQQKIIDKFASININAIFFNPRRNFWPNETGEIEKQIKWEQKHLEAADLIIMNILPNSKSPISLLELGLYSNKNMIVFCTSDFYRWENVKLTCEKYGIKLIESNNIEDIVNYICITLKIANFTPEELVYILELLKEYENHFGIEDDSEYEMLKNIRNKIYSL